MGSRGPRIKPQTSNIEQEMILRLHDIEKSKLGRKLQTPAEAQENKLRRHFERKET